jgi:hypothetical protein
MTELIRWKLDHGGEVLIQATPDGPEISPVSRSSALIETASNSLGTALASVRDAASEVLGQFRQMPVRPSKVEVEFGVQLTAQAGAVIAMTSVDGHLNVKLSWEAPALGEAASPDRSSTTDEDGQPS